jgi:hypothetical protein
MTPRLVERGLSDLSDPIRACYVACLLVSENRAPSLWAPRGQAARARAMGSQLR